MIGYIEHHIVNHCNLKCAGCSHFSSIAPEWFEDLADFESDFLELARKTNRNIATIRIMGGEPLLHPQVCDFLKIARRIFPTSEIQLVTNGTLIMERKEELLKVCNDNGICVCVSDYKLNFSIKDALSGFKLTRVDYKGELYNISLDLSGGQRTQEAFNKCDLHIYRWYYFQNGRMYPCCIGANIHIFESVFGVGIKNFDEDKISISIKDHSLLEIEHFLSNPIPLCRYCNTDLRPKTYHKFSVTKKDINEWICQ